MRKTPSHKKPILYAIDGYDKTYGNIHMVFSDKGIVYLGVGADASKQCPLEHWPISNQDIPEKISHWSRWVLAFIANPDKRCEVPFADEPSSFAKKVWQVLNEKKAFTYGQLANKLGYNPRTYARAIGGVMRRNSLAFLRPCHRVFHKDATKNAYRWGVGAKLKRLAQENIVNHQN